MPGSLIGTSVLRVEDPDLIRGRSTYVGNLRLPTHSAGLLHAEFVRSSIAHGVLTSVDTSAARRAPGVVAVYTAADLAIPRHHQFVPMNDICARPVLAEDKVRFVGEAVAVVVAETPVAAADAAELVDVRIEPLPAVSDPEQALVPGAPLQFDELGSNVAGGARDPEDTDPLDGADVVVRARLENQRVAVAPMEGNAIAVVPGAPGSGEPELTVHVSTQMPHLLRDRVAELFDLDKHAVRVVSPHVGGGFGGKAGIAPEHAVVVGAARRLGRPVTWVETRSENLVAMPHGRAQVHYVELGLRRDGTIVGMRARLIGDAGAYAGFGGGLVIGPTYAMAQGVYRIPALRYDGAVVLTNTTPVGAFRGAGRPEATAMLERVVDMAAAELGMDPAQLRRRNFLRPGDFPYTTATGATYDTGDYELPLTKALEVAGYEQLRAEQSRRRAADERLQLGIGLSSYVEITGGGGGGEFGAVEVHPDGTATVKVGTSGHGQGHATSFAMLAADTLGLPLESVRFVQSDTFTVPSGGGTGGSRSLQLGGNAVHAAAGAVLDQARKLAAELLEADVSDIVAADGAVGVAGVPDRGIGWAELATEALRRGSPLSAAPGFHQDGATFPFGTHVAVVEVDMETGMVRPVRHVAVDDCGRVLNPLIVTGQQHGGAAQGIAQALWEQVVYDEDGTPLSATLADYAMPSAADLPGFEVSTTETPTPRNPLGAKGIGESATVGATPAVQNAVVDALAHLGVRHLDMPCTPQRVWRAIRDARAGTLPDPWREPPDVFADLQPRKPQPAPAADI